MNMKRGFILGLIAVIIIGGIAVLSSKKEVKTEMMPANQSVQEDNNMDATDKMLEDELVTNTNTMADETPMMDSDPKHFVLTDIEGNSISLNDFKGQKVYIKFWASWCSICLAGMDEIDQLSGEMNDFVVLTVVSPNYNGEQSETDFLNWYKGLELKNMKPLLDTDGTVARAYGVRAYPTSVFIDTEGNIAKTVPGHMSEADIKEMMSEIK